MRGLTAADLFPIEDACENQPLVAVAERLLEYAAGVEASPLAIGQRDALLLEVRALTLGSELLLCDRCPACRLDLEVGATIPDLIVPAPGEAEADRLALVEVAGRPMRLRRATGADLRASLATAEPWARHQLAARCLSPLDGGAPVAPDALSDLDLDLVADRLARLDPQSDLLFAFACPACGHEWTAVLDIADYFWRELKEHAQALLDDIHDLARTYHWTEREILALAANRRNAYLARVRG